MRAVRWRAAGASPELGCQPTTASDESSRGAGPVPEAEVRFNVLRTSDFSAVVEVPFDADADCSACATPFVPRPCSMCSCGAGVSSIEEGSMSSPAVRMSRMSRSPRRAVGASSARPIGRATGPVGRRPPGGATGGGSFSPTPGPMAEPTTGCAPVWRAGAGAAAAASGTAGAVGRRGAPGNGGGGGGIGAGVGGRRRAARSCASAGTSVGGFQLPSFSFQTWRSASLGRGATLSMSCLRENGPVRLPSSAMYQATPSSAGGSGRGAARRSIGAVAGGPSGVRGTAGVGGRAGGEAPEDPTGDTGADGRRIAAPTPRRHLLPAR